VNKKITLSLLASLMVAAGAPAAHANDFLCKLFPILCPPPPTQHNPPSTPEPGTLGLLALGAAASVGMLRRKKK
jgi:hypothetical protein